jgi:hypothetical protein
MPSSITTASVTTWSYSVSGLMFKIMRCIPHNTSQCIIYRISFSRSQNHIVSTRKCALHHFDRVENIPQIWFESCSYHIKSPTVTNMHCSSHQKQKFTSCAYSALVYHGMWSEHAHVYVVYKHMHTVHTNVCM